MSWGARQPEASQETTLLSPRAGHTCKVFPPSRRTLAQLVAWGLADVTPLDALPPCSSRESTGRDSTVPSG